jgi:hypothetical protein
MPVLVRIVPRWIAQALRLAPPPLLGEPAAECLRGGPGRPAFPLDLEAGGDRVREALQGDLAISPLASLFLSDRADDGPCPGAESPLLGRCEHGRRFDLEDGLDAGLGLLRMLPSRPAGARKPELDFSERKLYGLPVAELDA